MNVVTGKMSTNQQGATAVQTPLRQEGRNLPPSFCKAPLMIMEVFEITAIIAVGCKLMVMNNKP